MAGGGVINNLDGAKFFKGFIYGGIQSAGHPARGVRIGALQNVSLSHEWNAVELRGPEALPPLGVGIGGETLTGSAEFATFLASHAKMLFGSVATYNAGTNKTRVRKLGNTEPVPFDLHLESPDSNTSTTDIEVDLYNCLAPSAQPFRADTRTWAFASFNFNVYGRTIGGEHVLFDIFLPGNQTDSSTGAGTPLDIS
jgi:hypothetical protein